MQEALRPRHGISYLRYYGAFLYPSNKGGRRNRGSRPCSAALSAWGQPRLHATLTQKKRRKNSNKNQLKASLTRTKSDLRLRYPHCTYCVLLPWWTSGLWDDCHRWRRLLGKTVFLLLTLWEPETSVPPPFCPWSAQQHKATTHLILFQPWRTQQQKATAHLFLFKEIKYSSQHFCFQLAKS